MSDKTYNLKCTIGEQTKKSTYTGGVSIKGSFTIDSAPDGDYSVNISTNCDGFDKTFDASVGQAVDFGKITTNFFDDTTIKVTVTGKSGQTGDAHIIITYHTC